MNLRIFLILLLLTTGCAVQRNPIPAGQVPGQAELSPQEVQYGSEVFNQLAQQYQLEDDPALNTRVRKIVARLSDAASNGTGGNPWHTYVFRDDNFKNAAATRGNYIFVWTGILKVTDSDHQLATILAHEVSHVLAQHTTPTSGETANQIIAGSSGQLTSSILAGTGYGTLAGVAGDLTSALLQGLIVNPGSQRLETEADTIGLFLMAKAGYNPLAAIDFWTKVQNDPDFGSMSISFLSSHPPSGKRLENLKRYLADAQQVYRRKRP